MNGVMAYQMLRAVAPGSAGHPHDHTGLQSEHR
jgi:hypothetical protein